MLKVAIYRWLCGVVWRVCWSRPWRWSRRARDLGTRVWNAGQTAMVRWMVAQCRKTGWCGYALEPDAEGNSWSVSALPMGPPPDQDWTLPPAELTLDMLYEDIRRCQAGHTDGGAREHGRTRTNTDGERKQGQ